MARANLKWNSKDDFFWDGLGHRDLRESSFSILATKKRTTTLSQIMHMHFLFAKSGQFFAIANLVSQFSVQPSGRSIEKENTYAVIIKRIILDLKINFFYIRGLRFFWLPEIILNQFIIFSKEAWPVFFLAWPCKFQKSTEFFQKEIHLRTSI